ncbi:restriction endonuclease subunit S [Staphylococcus xylosus]|uniref:restriction endonuclease subunit S n=1 Tax=Staphylococcus xylosus TaxID=1288 RepID=UPI002DB69C00|nr:restriction endonuclease subunit S [Staphylococcus xylosus]MEB6324371.1 restriction endonuclease subunit S [Staphylococcus xylosus]
MTNEVKNVPELRFPEFSEEWEEKILDEVSTFSKGKGISKNDLSKDGTSCILYGELYTTYDFIINKIKSKTLLDTKNLVKGKKNQVLIPSSGETPLDIATAAVINTTEDMLLGGDINVLTPVQKYDGKFISLSINGKNKSNLSKYAQGKSVVHLYNNDIKKLKIKFPVKNSEQRKIGDFFSKLDRQIELEEQKLEKLEEQKKGYMQKIFSQEFRFKDENGNNYPEWEETNLGNLLVEINQKSTLNDQYLLLSSTKNGLVNQSDYFKKQIGSKDNTGYKILRLNQMVISPQNLWLGNINFNDQFEIGIVSPSYRIYEFNSKVTFQFLKYLLKTSRYIYEYGQASEQGASVVRRNLNLDLFYEIKVNLPKLVEQEKIGNFFKKIDKSIDKQFNKVELLKERKKGFLQKMFV